MHGVTRRLPAAHECFCSVPTLTTGIRELASQHDLCNYIVFTVITTVLQTRLGATLFSHFEPWATEIKGEKWAQSDNAAKRGCTRADERMLLFYPEVGYSKSDNIQRRQSYLCLTSRSPSVWDISLYNFFFMTYMNLSYQSWMCNFQKIRAYNKACNSLQTSIISNKIQRPITIYFLSMSLTTRQGSITTCRNYQ